MVTIKRMILRPIARKHFFKKSLGSLVLTPYAQKQLLIRSLLPRWQIARKESTDQANMVYCLLGNIFFTVNYLINILAFAVSSVVLSIGSSTQCNWVL